MLFASFSSYAPCNRSIWLVWYCLLACLYSFSFWFYDFMKNTVLTDSFSASCILPGPYIEIFCCYYILKHCNSNEIFLTLSLSSFFFHSLPYTLWVLRFKPRTSHMRCKLKFLLHLLFFCPWWAFINIILNMSLNK